MISFFDTAERAFHSPIVRGPVCRLMSAAEAQFGGTGLSHDEAFSAPQHRARDKIGGFPHFAG